MSGSLWPHGLWNSPGQNIGVFWSTGILKNTFPSPGDLPNPGIEPRSPTLQAGSLPTGPQGKLKNTGVGTLSLLQIFPTQESNRGLLHCRWILYQLSYQGTSLQKEREKKLMISKSSPHIKCKYLRQHQKFSKGLDFPSILVGIIAQCNISNS